MELRLESQALLEAMHQAEQFFQNQQVVACMGDRFALSCLCLAEPIRLLRTQPSLLICSSDLESGYGIDLLKRVKAKLPTCQLLILLVRETKEVVQEAIPPKKLFSSPYRFFS